MADISNQATNFIVRVTNYIEDYVDAYNQYPDTSMEKYPDIADLKAIMIAIDSETTPSMQCGEIDVPILSDLLSRKYPDYITKTDWNVMLTSVFLGRITPKSNKAALVAGLAFLGLILYFSFKE